MLVNGADALMIDANGPFSFFTPVDDGVDFDMAVDSQPAGQICLRFERGREPSAEPMSRGS